MPEPTQTPPSETPKPSGLLSAPAPKPEGEAPPAETKPEGEKPAKGEESKPWYDGESHPFKLAEDLTKAGFELDADTLKEFLPVAKELKLDDAGQAQKLVDIAGKLVLKHYAAQEKAIDERAAKWADEVRADKELGGDKLGETVEAAVKVARKYGGDEFLKQLVELKLENSPHLIRFLARVAKATADDNFDAGRGDGAAADTGADRASRLYGPEFNKSFGKE